MSDCNEIIRLVLKEMGLAEFQINQLLGAIDEYIRTNSFDKSGVLRPEFDVCPKCGQEHPVIIKGGFANSGKQLFRCKHCGKRFTYDHLQLTFYSHQKPEFWKQFIADTINGKSLRDSARKYGIALSTAFNLRHRLLVFIEDRFDYVRLSSRVQADENFVGSSHKGLHDEEIPSRNNGEKASHRGLSNEQVCICGAVDKDGSTAFLRAYNVGMLSSDDAMNLVPHLQTGSSLETDGNQSYNRLTSVLNAKRTIVRDCKDHQAAVNLNTINSLHSHFATIYRHYRGVASKYINRYTSLISMMWNFRKISDKAGMIMEALKFIGHKMIKVTKETLAGYRIFAPEDLEYRQASA